MLDHFRVCWEPLRHYTPGAVKNAIRRTHTKQEAALIPLRSARSDCPA